MQQCYKCGEQTPISALNCNSCGSDLTSDQKYSFERFRSGKPSSSELDVFLDYPNYIKPGSRTVLELKVEVLEADIKDFFAAIYDDDDEKSSHYKGRNFKTPNQGKIFPVRFKYTPPVDTSKVYLTLYIGFRHKGQNIIKYAEFDLNCLVDGNLGKLGDIVTINDNSRSVNMDDAVKSSGALNGELSKRKIKQASWCRLCLKDESEWTPDPAKWRSSVLVESSDESRVSKPQSKEPFQPGDIFEGRYKCVRKLGEGGMGKVFLMSDSQLNDRKLAVKLLPGVLLGNKRAWKQLKQEAELALKITHPNVATLRGMEISKYYGPYLLIDYISGQSLEELLSDREKLPVSEILDLMLPIAEALDYAHTQGVIHRDIKPSNILIREKGNKPFLTDFGISCEVKDTMNRMTGRKDSGTLPYMSRDQLLGEKPDASQDIYSFGAMIFECATGNPPFYRGKIEYQIEHKEVNIQVLPVQLRDPLKRALSKEPSDRPKSCVSLIREIQGESFTVKLAEAKKSASVALESDKYKEARGYFHELLQREPEDKDLQKELAEIDKREKISIELNKKRAKEEAERARKLKAEKLARKRAKQAAAERVRKEDLIRKSREAGAILRVPEIDLEMVWVPSGTFMMGSPSGESGRYEYEGPVHRVTLDGFWIGKFAVTQSLYEEIMGKNPSRFEGEDRPVERVSWDDAMEFCGKLSSLTGKPFTLPTEAQWEYAARGGSLSKGYKYSGSNNLDDVGWYDENSGVKRKRQGFLRIPRTEILHETHSVGKKQGNELGLYDMSGNVIEWCLDDWHNSYNGAPSDGSRWGDGSGSFRVFRGGSWYYSSRYCRSAHRYRSRPSNTGNNLGFRVVESIGH